MTYVFGEFVIDPRRRMLTRSTGDAITISAKAFDALVYLAQHAGEVVPRAALVAALWPRAVVEDNNLSQTIRALRVALDDAGPPHRYVTTVPRRGYQFVADVIERPAAERTATRVTASRGDPIGVVALACTIAVVLTSAVLLAAVYPRHSVESARFAQARAPDQVIRPNESIWPLPAVIACQSEPANSITPRCRAVLETARERARARKLGLHAT